MVVEIQDSGIVKIAAKDFPAIAVNVLEKLGYHVSRASNQLDQIIAVDQLNEQVGRDIWKHKYKVVLQWSATAAGDDGNRLVVIQFYQGDWSVNHQDVLLTSGNDITVDRYRKPSDYVGRCIYKYDSAGHFLEVAKLDSQQNTEVTATVERTKHGKFYSLTVKPTGGNTSTYYDTDGTNVKDQFYSSSLLMNIDKYVEPPTALTGPISPSDPSAGRSSPFLEPPAPLGRGINGPSPFQVSPEKSADTPDVVRPASPFSRNDEHLKPSPFLPSSSPTPETDKLLEQIKNNR